MTKAIYTLLIATAITGSAVDATQRPQRPTTPSPTTSSTNRPALAADQSICPDTLNYTQLTQIQAGTLVLSGWKFKLHTQLSAFNSMLPNKAEGISKKTRDAHISTGTGKQRAIISGITGPFLKCTYSYSTLLGKTTEFAITSEPTEHKNEPKGLTEAIMAG